MEIKRIFTILFLSFGICFALQAQTKEEKKSQKEAQKLEREEIERVLSIYKADKCSFSELRLSLFKVDRMAKDEKEQYLVRHTSEGVKAVSRTDGYRLIFAREKDTHFYANLQVDRSRPSSFVYDKEISLEALDKINKDDKFSELSKPTEKTYNGFASFSTNRKEIMGSIIGTSLLFDEKNKIMITVYFINEPKDVKAEFKLFSNIQEWKKLRDDFLNSFTKCVADNLK
jgi:hypothetical protein